MTSSIFWHITINRLNSLHSVAFILTGFMLILVHISYLSLNNLFNILNGQCYYNKTYVVYQSFVKNIN